MVDTDSNMYFLYIEYFCIMNDVQCAWQIYEILENDKYGSFSNRFMGYIIYRQSSKILVYIFSTFLIFGLLCNLPKLRTM